MPETKREKFQRLMPPRLEKAIYHIGLLRNLTSHNYENTKEEAHQLVEQLQAAVDEIAEAFGVQPNPVVAPQPEPEPEPEPKNQPVSIVEVVAPGPGVAIPGRDRRDIRAGLRQIHDGDVRGGVKAIQKVVLGWVVPDQIEEEEKVA